MTVESSSTVIDNFTPNYLQFDCAHSISLKSSNKMLCLLTYSDSANSVDNTSYSINYSSNIDKHYVTREINSFNINFDTLNVTDVQYDNCEFIVKNGLSEIIENTYVTDDAYVSDCSAPIKETANGIKYIKIECQVNMYFEIELDILKIAECIYSLPKGMKYSQTKIYGTPISKGMFTSYLAIDENNIVELIFDISGIQRIL